MTHKNEQMEDKLATKVICATRKINVGRLNNADKMENNPQISKAMSGLLTWDTRLKRSEYVYIKEKSKSGN